MTHLLKKEWLADIAARKEQIIAYRRQQTGEPSLD